MATRKELKERAKECLKKYYWMALLVSVIATCLGGEAGISFNVSFPSYNYTSDSSIVYSDVNNEAVVVFIISFLIIFLILFLIGLAIQSFLGNVIQMGHASYYLESRNIQSDAKFDRLFYGFTCGSYMNVVKTMFMRNLFIFLWTLVLIIPGIIKDYEYKMVPYILAENPNISYKDALKLSKELMYGHKFEFFILQCSFIGWQLLGFCLCCIGIIFLLPYVNATYAEFYAELKKNHQVNIA